MAEKLVKAFGVYFIIWGCLTFIYNFADLINNILTLTGKGLYLYSTPAVLGVMDWAIPIVAIIGAFLLFFAGISVNRLKESSVKLVIIASLVFLLKQLMNLGNDIQAIIKDTPSYAFYGVGFGISLHFFSLLVWIFVMVFFNRAHVKSFLRN